MFGASMGGFPHGSFYKKAVAQGDTTYQLRIDGLNFDRDGFYMGVVSVICGANQTPVIYFNDDRVQSNYYCARRTASGVTTFSINAPALSAGGADINTEFLRIFKDARGRICYRSDGFQGTNMSNFDYYMGVKTTAEELNCVAIAGSASEVMVKGSFIELYGMR